MSTTGSTLYILFWNVYVASIFAHQTYSMRIIVLHRSPLVADRLICHICDSLQELNCTSEFEIRHAESEDDLESAELIIYDLGYSVGKEIEILKKIKAGPTTPIVICLYRILNASEHSKLRSCGADYLLDIDLEIEQIPLFILSIIQKKNSSHEER